MGPWWGEVDGRSLGANVDRSGRLGRVHRVLLSRLLQRIVFTKTTRSSTSAPSEERSATDFVKFVHSVSFYPAPSFYSFLLNAPVVTIERRD